MLIAGEWCDAEDGATADVLNPATGEVIATTSDNQYRFSPSLSGTHSFTVYPVIDNQQIELQSPTSTSSVQLDSESVPDAPGPSESIGMVLSMIMIIIGIGGVSYSFIQRRD